MLTCVFSAGRNAASPESTLWRPAQGTKPITQVASQIVKPRQTALVAHCVHRLRDGSSCNSCDPRGVVGVPASPSVLGGKFQMQPQFLLQVAIVSAWLKGSPETSNPLAEAGHSHSPFVLSPVVQERVHDGRHTIPLRLFGGELTASCGDDVVEARLSVGVGHVQPLPGVYLPPQWCTTCSIRRSNSQ